MIAKLGAALRRNPDDRQKNMSCGEHEGQARARIYSTRPNHSRVGHDITPSLP
jgi:hypothetical protein